MIAPHLNLDDMCDYCNRAKRHEIYRVFDLSTEAPKLITLRMCQLHRNKYFNGMTDFTDKNRAQAYLITRVLSNDPIS